MVKYANRGKPKKSKRMTLQQKYKIQRKIKEHHKKSRRAAKKMQDAGMKKKAKMDVIPNLYPFKAELIKAQELHKAEQQQLKAKKKLAGTQIQQQVEGVDEGNEPNIAVVHGAKLFNDYTDLIDAADVVVEVLDSRDPQASRDEAVEKEILSAGKKLFFVLSKSDLVPQEQLNKWKTHLNAQHPTVVFSSVNDVQSNITNLITEIQQKSQGKETKIGFLGYPLMGKSTLVNLLIAHTHYTKPYRTKSKIDLHQLSNHLFLIDTLGVINTNPTASLLFNSTFNHKQLIALIIQKVGKPFLRNFYKITTFKQSQDFLQKVAKATGKLQKGGLPNRHAAAKLVINDLRDNKLTFFSKV